MKDTLKIIIIVALCGLALSATCQVRIGAGFGYHNGFVGQLITGYNHNGIELQSGFNSSQFKKRIDIPVTIGPVLPSGETMLRPYFGASYVSMGKSLDRYKGAVLMPGSTSGWTFNAGFQVMRGNFYIDMGYARGWMATVGMSGVFGNQ